MVAADPDLNEFSTSSQVVATYTFTDLLSGIGTQVFYGTIFQDSVATTLKLLTSVQASRGLSAQASLADNQTHVLNTNEFNRTSRVKGDATLICALRRTGADTNFTAKISHVNGATAVVTDISSTITSTTSATADGYVWAFPLPLTTTRLNVGDQLRLTIVLPDSGTPGSAIWCDPKGASAEPFKLLIPFDLEL